MPDLYHFWSSFESQRVRLALSCKGIDWTDHALRYDDDQTFYDLGTARRVPQLVLDSGERLEHSVRILWQADHHFPQGERLVDGRIDTAAWHALLEWRRRVDTILDRLYAPLRPAYRDIAADAETMAAYKAEVAHKYGLSLEALANDRYAGYQQLARLSRLADLARHLSQNRFYTGAISIADLLLTADLFPLQLHDGLSLPVDLMYYLERVQDSCELELRQGLVAEPA